MNVQHFLQAIERNGGGHYSLSEGILNPTKGYLSPVPRTMEEFPYMDQEFLSAYVMKHIEELALSQRYISAYRTAGTWSLNISICLSKEAATELAYVNGEEYVYNLCNGTHIEIFKC